jgi:hypothetical protein
MFLATGDFQRFFSNAFGIMGVGYCVRAIILFFIGGFIAWLYPDETARIKVFLLGLGAPALIGGFLSTASNPTTAPVARAVSSAGFVTAVYAQTTMSADELKRFTMPAPSPVAQFVEGLTGYQPKNVWFVIAGSFLSLDNAKAYAGKINSSFPGFHADVYAPYLDDPSYAVVIGAQLTLGDAKALRDRAVSAGLDKQTYYKTFPNLPLP